MQTNSAREENLRSPIGKSAWHRFADLLIISRRVAEHLDASDGFTLIEVLVALTILGISLAVLLGLFSQDLALARESSIEMKARGLAQYLLVNAETDDQIRQGTTIGHTPSNFSWQVDIQPYSTESQQTWPFRLLTVHATVFWSEAGRRKLVTLQTLRLSRKEPMA